MRGAYIHPPYKLRFNVSGSRKRRFQHGHWKKIGNLGRDKNGETKILQKLAPKRKEISVNFTPIILS